MLLGAHFLLPIGGLIMSDLNGKLVQEGLTFDDVLLVPQESNVLPNQVSLETKLTKNIKLNIPN